MQQDVNNNNSRFVKYAFACVLLFIAAFGFILAPHTSAFSTELSYTFSGLALVVVATSILAKAIKDDMDRVNGI